MRLQIRSWQQRRRNNIIRAAVRAFVEGAFTPSISLEILESVHIAILTSDRCSQTDEEMVREVMKRVEANNAASFYLLANSYHDGVGGIGIQPDQAKAIEMYVKAADLGSSQAHYCLGNIYYDGGDSKKAKFHFEAAAMAGDEVARINLGIMETRSGNVERGLSIG